MNDREKLMNQLRLGRPMTVGGGGNTIRPAGEADQKGSQLVKPHRWGC